MNIGALAKAADCRVVTVRYYEKEGLLAKALRGANGYREYSADDLERLRFVRHCRDHGVALADIKILLKLRQAPEGDCAPVDRLVDSLISKLEAQIKSIKLLRQHLVTLKGRCHGGSIADCAILKGLTERTGCPCGERSAGEK
jgi:DNA-binding transcriptional MerR regulator